MTTDPIRTACRAFHLSGGEAAYSRLLALAPPGLDPVRLREWVATHYVAYLDAYNAEQRAARVDTKG